MRTAAGLLAALLVVMAAPAAWSQAPGTAAGAPQAAEKPDDPGDPWPVAKQALDLHAQGRDAQALPFALQALALAERRFGAEDAQLAPFLQMVAEIYRGAGRPADAIPLVERALTINQRVHGPQSAEAAASLNALGVLHLARGDTAVARPLLERALAGREAALGPDHPYVAATLTNLGAVLDELGRPAEALPLHQRALAIREREAGADDPRTATALNNVAESLGALGRYAEALPLHQRALAMRERALGPEHPDTAASLNNVSELLDTLGRREQSLAMTQRAIAINARMLGPTHPSTLLAQGNLVYKLVSAGRLDAALALAQRTYDSVLQSQGEQAPAAGSAALRLAYVHQARGEFAQALPVAQRALANREAARGPNHPETAVALNNLAEIYGAMGEYGQAMALHRRALAIREAAYGPMHPEVASGLNNLASLYKALGQLDEAEPLLRRALAIHEQAYGAEHPDTALSLNNLGHLLMESGRNDAALPLLRRALAVAESALGPEHPNTATALNNVAAALENLGRGQEAMALHERALAIRERAFGPQHASVAMTLNNQAALLETLGRPEAALPLYRRALRILQAAHAASPQPVLLAAVHTRLAGAHEQRGEIDLAIFHLKQAVNLTQGLRAGAGTLELATRQSFVRSVATRYQRLAELLVRQGRLPEAEQVLALLKLDERRELVRGDAQDRSESALAALAPAERELAERMNDNALRLARAQAELDALGAAESPRRAQLVAQIQADSETLDDLLGDAAAALAAAAPRGGGGRAGFAAAVEERDAIASRLATLNERGNARAAALYIVPGEKATTFLLVTAQGAVGHTGGLGEAALDRLVAQLRQAVQARSPDYRDSAAALHAALIAPVAPLLAAARIDTLMLYLVGSLRYLPVAALYDGAAKQHLIEQYALAVYTVGGLRDALAEPPKARWSAAGLGVSRALAGFDALPAVPGELRSVVRQGGEIAVTAPAGVLPGDRYLDEAFTRERLGILARRDSRFAVLHMATHFKLVPGREDESQLLLGDGDLLSMRQLRSDATLAFGNYDLITLSACNTSMGGAAGGGGAEFEGLATTLMKKGARAVMATLWEVQDSGTARLMRAFYAARGETRRMHKAQALRQAQLALLRGELRDETGRLDFTHPYYWAPFILMGNWL